MKMPILINSDVIPAFVCLLARAASSHQHQRKRVHGLQLFLLCRDVAEYV